MDEVWDGAREAAVVRGTASMISAGFFLKRPTHAIYCVLLQDLINHIV